VDFSLNQKCFEKLLLYSAQNNPYVGSKGKARLNAAQRVMIHKKIINPTL